MLVPTFRSVIGIWISLASKPLLRRLWVGRPEALRTLRKELRNAALTSNHRRASLAPQALDFPPSNIGTATTCWIPGEGKQLLMPRGGANPLSPTISGTTFPIVTKNNWMIGCGASQPVMVGKAFLPWLLMAHAIPLLTCSTVRIRRLLVGQVVVALKLLRPRRPRGPPRHGALHLWWLRGTSILLREDAFMYVTQIQDRFGNTLTYNYDPTTGYLTSITASDGREVDVTYVSGSYLIQTITAKATNVASRTWTYSYTNDGLTGVQLPDGSAWSYNLAIDR